MVSAIRRNIACCFLAAICCASTAVAVAAADSAQRAEKAPQPRDRNIQPAQSQSESAIVRALSAKLFRHADRVIARFDRNGSGQLEQSEWQEASAALSIELERLDADGDGVVGALEVAEYIAAFARHRLLEPLVRTRQAAPEPPPLLQPSTPPAPAEGSVWRDDAETARSVDSRNPDREPGQPSARYPAKKFHVSPSRLPPGLPEWFLARDADGDGQLDLAEFAPQGGQWAMEQFRRYDLNNDGLITPQEAIAGAKQSSGSQQGSPKHAQQPR